MGYTLDGSQIHIRDYTEAHKTIQPCTLKPGANLEPLITQTFMVFGLSEEARVLGGNPHIPRAHTLFRKAPAGIFTGNLLAVR